MAGDRDTRRIARQFKWIERMAPAMRRPLAALQARGWWILRVPLAIAFIIGGIFSFLPVLGIWMLPLGLLLLAVDIPLLRPLVGALLVRARRAISRLVRWVRRSQS